MVIAGQRWEVIAGGFERQRAAWQDARLSDGGVLRQGKTRRKNEGRAGQP